MLCINAKQLSKSYGSSTLAVNNLDLSIESGQIFGFLGPNGAGKSTTIKLLTTLIQPSSGSLEIFGLDASKYPLQIRSKIGVVLQQPSYEPTLSVEKSLDKYGMMWNIPSNIRKKRVEQLLIDFELIQIRKKRNEDLSIGQRRRVQVAREFMHDMDLLFLDEPTVGLDPASRRKLFDFLKSKVKAGLTIFYTTHALPDVEYLCDNVAMINNGRILIIDTPESLKQTYGNREKIIKIRIAKTTNDLKKLLEKIPNCVIDPRLNTIMIKSNVSENILSDTLHILNQQNITIDDLSITPTNLEETFLKIISEQNASNY